MPDKLIPLEKLLISRSGRTNSNFKTFTFLAIGIYLVGTTLWRYYALGIREKMLPNMIVGIAAFFALRYQKLIYVSPVGLVKETHTWITHHREVLKWEEIKFITIMHKRQGMMLFLERDTLGWKVLFENDQTDQLKKLFEKYIPDVEVNEMDR